MACRTEDARRLWRSLCQLDRETSHVSHDIDLYERTELKELPDYDVGCFSRVGLKLQLCDHEGGSLRVTGAIDGRLRRATRSVLLSLVFTAKSVSIAAAENGAVKEVFHESLADDKAKHAAMGKLAAWLRVIHDVYHNVTFVGRQVTASYVGLAACYVAETRALEPAAPALSTVILDIDSMWRALVHVVGPEVLDGVLALFLEDLNLADTSAVARRQLRVHELILTMADRHRARA